MITLDKPRQMNISMRFLCHLLASIYITELYAGLSVPLAFVATAVVTTGAVNLAADGTTPGSGVVWYPCQSSCKLQDTRGS